MLIINIPWHTERHQTNRYVTKRARCVIMRTRLSTSRWTVTSNWSARRLPRGGTRRAWRITIYLTSFVRLLIYVSFLFISIDFGTLHDYRKNLHVAVLLLNDSCHRPSFINETRVKFITIYFMHWIIAWKSHASLQTGWLDRSDIIENWCLAENKRKNICIVFCLVSEVIEGFF